MFRFFTKEWLVSKFFLQFCINEESCVVFVVSTTGDGEPPDTVRKFYRRINKKTLPENYLEKLKFAFLGMQLGFLLHI